MSTTPKKYVFTEVVDGKQDPDKTVWVMRNAEGVYVLVTSEGETLKVELVIPGDTSGYKMMFHKRSRWKLKHCAGLSGIKFVPIHLQNLAGDITLLYESSVDHWVMLDHGVVVWKPDIEAVDSLLGSNRFYMEDTNASTINFKLDNLYNTRGVCP